MRKFRLFLVENLDFIKCTCYAKDAQRIENWLCGGDYLVTIDVGYLNAYRRNMGL